MKQTIQKTIITTMVLFSLTQTLSAFNGDGHRNITKDAVRNTVNTEALTRFSQVSTIGDTGDAWYQSASHFDNCAWNEGLTWIDDYLNNAVQTSIIYRNNGYQSSDKDIVFNNLGYVVHASEDFYAHSNWIETHEEGDIAQLGIISTEKPSDWFSGTYPDDYPQLCPTGTPTHDEYNKDNPSKAGYDEGYTDAVLEVKLQIDEFKKRLIEEIGTETANEILFYLGLDPTQEVCTLETNLIKGSNFENNSSLYNWNHNSGAGHLLLANYSTNWAGIAPSNAGSYFLYATEGNASVSQTIDISNCINQHNVSYDFNAYLGGYGDGDTIKVKLDFKDIDNNILVSYNTGDFTSDKMMTTVKHTDFIPNNAQTVTANLIFTRIHGSDTDGYIDNFILKIKENNDTTDTIKPQITLLGDANISLILGETYTDAGAMAYDNVDGNITNNILTVSTIDTSTVGTYTVTYNVSDTVGNNADEVTRTVIVYESDQNDSCILNTNLILGSTFEIASDMNAWNHTSGNGHLVRANYSTGWAGTAASNAGEYFLYATESNITVIQTIDLGNCTTHTNLAYDFSSLVGGYGDNDTVAITLDFKDNANNILMTYNTGDLTANKNMYTISNQATLPNDVQKLTVSLSFKRVKGTDTDGYLDNFTLQLTDN